MKGSRTKNKDKAKVITAKIKSPDKSLREIQEETGLPKSTISDILNNDLPEVRNSSEIISDIIENDMESIKTMSQITKRYLKQINSKDELDRGDIAVVNTTVESALKRSQLLSNKPTERIEHNLDNMSTKELELARQKLLNS